MPVATALLLLGSLMGLEPRHLRTEYLVEPLGLATPRPRLSWTVTSTERRQRQTAYQIVAGATPEAVAAGRGELWDSGRIESSQTGQVEWAGAPLSARQRVYWSVRVWDAGGDASAWAPPASFAVGLLEPGDWRAAWIGPAGEPPASSRDHNGYHSELTPEPATTKWVQVDLGQTTRIEAVRLYPANPYNWNPRTPGFGFPVRYRLEASDEPEFATPRLLADRTDADQPNPGGEPVTLEFAPVSARYVRLTATLLWRRDAEACALALAELEVLARGESLARGAAVTALDSIETAGWSRDRLTDGETRSLAPQPAEALPATMLRREFDLPAAPGRAMLYATARGVYELWLNGRRVGEQLLAPEWTDYRKRIQAQAYDVTELLRPGANALGAVLGDGWFAGRLGLAGPGRWHYGALPSLLVQLELDGAPVLLSDDTWRMTDEGPLRRADILDGEVYDARRQMRGWNEPAFDDSAWSPAAAVPEPAALLVMQPNEPLRVVDEVTPIAVTEPAPGVAIFDLGQNLVGWGRLTVRGQAGDELAIRHGEMLNDDGTLYVDNLRGAPQVDRYLCRGGGAEIYEPRFTYHGFRYLEVSGLKYRPAPGDLLARVICSSSPEAGTFECSDADLNKLWSAIFWTQRANLFSTPTDCPQRDERLGWMGDIQAFCPTGMYNMDLAGFMTKWLADVRDAQGLEGRYPDFAPLLPTTPPGNAPAWADAGVIIPWHQWTHYADRRLLEEHFESMCRFIDHLAESNPDRLWRESVGANYSDWLNADTLILEGFPKTGGAPPKELFATAFWAHSTRLLADLAAALGRDAEAAKYRALRGEIEAAFQRAFVQPDGRLTGETQSGYALALAFDLLPNELRGAAAEHLVAAFEPYGGKISTGIQSTVRLMQALRDTGHVDEAYRLLNERGCPSWLFTIDQGATTIWERWDGYVAGRGFQNAGMNSFNHWAFGSVGEWMVETILGLRVDPERPGFEHVTIEPVPGGGLTWARGRYESIRGTFGLEWRQEGGQFSLEVDLPANTTASVVMPYASPISVDDPTVRLPRLAGRTRVALGSGRYRLTQATP